MTKISSITSFPGEDISSFFIESFSEDDSSFEHDVDITEGKITKPKQAQ
ncbi:MAG: hypothetical protein HDR43_02960 [Mycoplasma sp.]|nr:hypothetical protein [Mycoplasma sp.]